MYATISPVEWITYQPVDFPCYYPGCNHQATEKVTIHMPHGSTLTVVCCSLCAKKAVEDPQGFINDLTK